MGKKKLFGELGIELGYLDVEKVLRAVRKQEQMAERERELIGKILRDSGDLSEVMIQEILSRQREAEEEEF
ncbi:MAG: hypothetical protein NUV68_00805 [Caldiserica bacterium]|jgi:hypothetical protein|nr:hypothetical protein [Caldisericota bacterium]MDH7561899.1 hypothetical protein [Caldisericota bacterium]